MNGPLNNSAKSRGIYFLANDNVYDMTVAFLNSFRLHNPTVPLCLIPFRDDIERLRALSTEYDFDVYEDLDYLAECDEISTHFHDRVCGQYRKLAIWDGKFDEFIYIDIDTVVLQDLSFAFDFITDYAFTVSMSNVPVLLKWVWNNIQSPSLPASGGVARNEPGWVPRSLSDALTADQIAYAANTGFIVSTKRAILLDEARDKIAAAVKLKPWMNLTCYEQPFLNYLIVTSGKTHSSIYEIKRLRNRSDIPEEVWAGIKVPGVTIRDGYVYLGDLRNPANFAFVHWNGVWRRHHIDPVSAQVIEAGDPEQSDEMPYRELWQHYRDLRHGGVAVR